MTFEIVLHLIFQIKFDNRIFNQINEKILHVIKQSVDAYKSPLVRRTKCIRAFQANQGINDHLHAVNKFDALETILELIETA